MAVFLFTEVIGDHTSDYDETANNALEESWIVTQDPGLKCAVKQVVRSKGYGRRQRQPKGTKPRRWKANKNNNNSGAKKVEEEIKSVRTSLEDDESTSSSIAIVPSPEPLTRPATIPVAASTVLAASSDAKQMAAIHSARAVKQKKKQVIQTKNW